MKNVRLEDRDSRIDGTQAVHCETPARAVKVMEWVAEESQATLRTTSRMYTDAYILVLVDFEDGLFNKEGVIDDFRETFG